MVPKRKIKVLSTVYGGWGREPNSLEGPSKQPWAAGVGFPFPDLLGRFSRPYQTLLVPLSQQKPA